VSLDTSSYSDVNVSFWFNDDDNDVIDVFVYWLNDASTWISMGPIDAGSLGLNDDTWNFNYSYSTDSQFLHAGFAIRFWAEEDNNENYWIDDINVSGTASIPSEVSFNQSSVDLGDSTNNLTAIAKISSTQTNTNTRVICGNGACDGVTTNWTTQTLNDGDEEAISFNCTNVTTGVYSAIYNLSSDEDTTNDTYTIDCETWAYGVLEAQIHIPTNDSGYAQYDTNLTINSTVNCTGSGNRRCGIVQAMTRYNFSSSDPDTIINTTEGDTPFYVMTHLYRPSSWKIGAYALNPENATDGAFNDTANYSEIYLNNSANHINYTFDLLDSTTTFNISATLYMFPSLSGGSAGMEIWNFTSGSFDTLAIDIPWDSPSQNITRGKSDWINSTGGVIFKFTSRGANPTKYLRITDVFANTSNGTINYPGLANLSKLDGGESATFNTTLNITSSSNEEYFLDVFFNSSYGSASVADSETPLRSVLLNPGVVAGDSCTCAGLNTNWEIDFSDSCLIYSDCDLGTGNITWTGTGTTVFNATIESYKMDPPPSGGLLKIGPQCLVKLG
jgi:hypothetical protein